MQLHKKLTEIRQLLENHQVSAFIQPVHDEFLSEYPPSCFKRLEWFCGFSGSAGTLVITREKAALFVDGRYTIQAPAEVDSPLITILNSGDISVDTWLSEQLSNTAIGYDAALVTPASHKRLSDALAKSGLTLAAIPNLIDALWHDRPAFPQTPVFLHDEKLAGESSASKCKTVANTIVKHNAAALLISAPDAVCWLLNIRARDVECTPLILARAILYADGSAELLTDAKRLPALPAHIRASDRDTTLAKLAGKTLLVDEAQMPLSLLDACKAASIKTQHITDPCTALKARKNLTQLDAIKHAHIIDGVAISKLLHWLDTNNDIRSVSEITIADQLLHFRAEHNDFLEPSFPTIAGSGKNGAIVHYRANDKTNRTLQDNDMLLLDSGGQYTHGTTDITRTIAIGTPTDEQKRNNTLVLKGHIALARATFPKGTRGSQLDTLARQFLWQHGLDYDHGTGHGVGQFLGVHEGPQRISKRGGDVELEVGMILSNEPGYYKQDAYGIRIESLVAVVEKEKGWLAFETLTCAPIDVKLIDFSLLTEAENQWLEQYHHWVKKSLSPLLPPHIASWLP